MPDESTDYYLEKAQQCRRIARNILNRDDPMVTSLLALADEFDAKAVTFSAQE